MKVLQNSTYIYEYIRYIFARITRINDDIYTYKFTICEMNLNIFTR